MRLGQILQGSMVVLFLIPSLLPTFSLASTHSRRGPTSQRLFSHRAAKSAKPASQRAIDDSRASQIQTALVHAGYLTGETSGHWDTQTEGAMQKFQADNGWQTKLIPDSRAIIKLGLGPNTSENTPSAVGNETSIASSASTFLK